MAEKISRTMSLEATIGLVISNTDLLFEIFLRLPAISLIRFKLVSKSWLSLISDPEFAITHSRRNTIESPVADFYYQDWKRDVSISLDYGSSVPSLTCLDPIRKNAESNNNFEIVHSCKGLILLIHERSWRLIVLNPTTQKYRLLTAPLEDRLLHCRYADKCDLLLAFEPLKSHHYKVVILLGDFDVYLFSSQSGSWKEISIDHSPASRSTRRVYWNGAIHWLNGMNMLLQFDFDTEKMTVTQLLPKPRIYWRDNTRYFGESNGRLFLIQYRKLGALGFRMLEMNKNTLCWDIKHQVNLRPLLLQFPEVQPELGCESHRYSILYVKSGDDMKSCSLILAIPGKVVLYEVKKRKSHTNTIILCELPDAFSPLVWHTDVLPELRDASLPWRWQSFHPYIQCLAPV